MLLIVATAHTVDQPESHKDIGIGVPETARFRAIMWSFFYNLRIGAEKKLPIV